MKTLIVILMLAIAGPAFGKTNEQMLNQYCENLKKRQEYGHERAQYQTGYKSIDPKADQLTKKMQALTNANLKLSMKHEKLYHSILQEADCQLRAQR